MPVSGQESTKFKAEKSESLIPIEADVDPCNTFIPGARAQRGILSLCRYPLAFDWIVEAEGGTSAGPWDTGVDTIVSDAIGSRGYDRCVGDLISWEGSGRELSLWRRRLVAVGETDFLIMLSPPFERVGEGRYGDVARSGPGWAYIDIGMA